MASALAGLLACLSVVTQAAVPSQRPPVGAATAQISGTIRNAADDKPIARARVVATSNVLEEPRATITNSDGTYALTDLPAGAYKVSATHTGFATRVYGQGRAIDGSPVAVGPGQHVGNIDLALGTGAVIAGRILDEDGAPFAGALVEALLTHVESGTTSLYSVATSQTDDRGEFRLFGLGAGEYYVSAQDPAFRAVSSPKGVLHYSPTYYPGTPLADQAKRLAVGAGADPPRIEFRIQVVAPARISGQLLTFDGRQLASGTVVMSSIEGDGVPVAQPEHITMLPDGRFTFEQVLPGHYQIRARGVTDSAAASLFAVYPIEVLGTDVDGIALTLRPGALVEGRVGVENKHGTKPPALTLLRVRAPSVDGNTFGDALTGTVQTDGSFSIRGVMNGSHQIVVEGLEPPWVLKSVMLHGADVTDLEVPLTPFEQIHDLRVTITDAGSDVSGVVQNASNLPVADIAVMVFSKVPLFWLRTNRRMRVTYTDREGRFSVPGLPAGEYLAVASESIDERDLGRRDRIQALQRYAVPFRLAADDAKATVTVHLAPATPMPAAR
jgi:hypothetical protein